jgi:hypothetical protein
MTSMSAVEISARHELGAIIHHVMTQRCTPEYQDEAERLREIQMELEKARQRLWPPNMS